MWTGRDGITELLLEDNSRWLYEHHSGLITHQLNLSVGKVQMLMGIYIKWVHKLTLYLQQCCKIQRASLRISLKVSSSEQTIMRHLATIKIHYLINMYY